MAVLCAAGFATSLAIAGAYGAGYRLNLTPSVPVGLWRVTFGVMPHRGEVAFWCPPDTPLFRAARARGYVPHGVTCAGGYVPMFKPVAALAGDEVVIRPDGVAVNGVLLPRTAPIAHDGDGRPLPTLRPGAFRVRRGEVWFVSTFNARSFDARYYGAMPAARIQGVMRPVLTRAYAD